MHILLIRHGETEHNVAGLLAGVTDSKLTNHGVLQTQRLAKHLIKDRSLTFTHIYASDLQRAFMTASELEKAQNAPEDIGNKVSLIKLELLREQDFGSLELVSWSSRHDPTQTSKIPKHTDPDFKPKETADAMKRRAKSFLKDFIAPLQAFDEEEDIRIAVVSHGLFLSSLWKVIVAQFPSRNVLLDPEAGSTISGRPLEYMPSWTNTGYLELMITVLQTSSTVASEPQSSNEPLIQMESLFENRVLKIIAVNSKEHLSNLKRTRGGVGSAAFDQRQSSIDLFFKKPRLEQKDS